MVLVNSARYSYNVWKQSILYLVKKQSSRDVNIYESLANQELISNYQIYIRDSQISEELTLIFFFFQILSYVNFLSLVFFAQFKFFFNNGCHALVFIYFIPFRNFTQRCVRNAYTQIYTKLYIYIANICMHSDLFDEFSYPFNTQSCL